MAVAAYAFSPIDLIPDFIPVLGLLDDLLIVPFGVWATLRFMPEPLIADLRAQAALLAERPLSKVGLAIVLTAWTAAALLLWRSLTT